MYVEYLFDYTVWWGYITIRMKKERTTIMIIAEMNVPEDLRLSLLSAHVKLRQRYNLWLANRRVVGDNHGQAIDSKAAAGTGGNGSPGDGN